MKKTRYPLPIIVLLAALVYWLLPGQLQKGLRQIALVHLTSTDALSGDGFREGMTALGMRGDQGLDETKTKFHRVSS